MISYEHIGINILENWREGLGRGKNMMDLRFAEVHFFFVEGAEPAEHLHIASRACLL